MRRADTLPRRFSLVTLLVAFLAMPLTGRQQPAATSLSHTQIVLLGTGDPAADPDQSGPATAVIVNDTFYLTILVPESCGAQRPPLLIGGSKRSNRRTCASPS